MNKGRKQKLKGGDESDWVSTKSRSIHGRWLYRISKAIKRGMNKRARQEAKEDIKENIDG